MTQKYIDELDEVVEKVSLEKENAASSQVVQVAVGHPPLLLPMYQVIGLI